MLEKIQTSKLELGDYLSIAWTLFKENSKPLFAIILITSLFGESLITASHSGLLTLFVVLISLLGYIATVFILDAGINNTSLDMSQLLSKCFSRLPAFLWTIILGGLFSLLGFILLIIPGIYLSTCYSFSAYAAILREKSGRAALNYSSDLVKPKFWQVFINYLCIGLLAAILMFVAKFFFGFFGSGNVVNFVLNIVNSSIQTFFEVVTFVWFLNYDSSKPGEAEVKSPEA